MSINFRGSRRDETQILRSELNSNKLEVRRKAVKKVTYTYQGIVKLTQLLC